MDTNVTRDIEEAVQRALAAGGIQGTVTLTGRTMSLRAGGAPTEIDALYLIEQWPLLPEDLRERKAADVAARLTEAQRAARSGSAAPPRAPSLRPTGLPAKGPRRPIVLPGGAIVVLLAAAALGWFWFKSRSTSAPPSPSASARPETAEERDARLCEAGRTQMLSSGKIPDIDAQVWLAELWLATSKPGDDMARSKELASLVEQGRLTAGADPDLAALSQATVELVGEESAPGLAWRGMHVRFHGGYVSAFFETAGRERLNRVAGKLADATGAEMGAMYARCAHLRYHDVGAWFRGTTPALASSALLYSIGYVSERPRTNRDATTPPTASDLAALLATMAKLDKGKIEGAVREAGGVFAPGLGDAPTHIVFPLFGPTGAARASGLVATAAGIGAGTPRPAASGAAP